MHAERLSALAQTTQAAKPITGSTRARVRGFVRAALTDRVLARFLRDPQTKVGPVQPRPQRQVEPPTQPAGVITA